MNVGVYQGAAALDSLQRWQEIISQNIAASSVPGYKKTELSFEGVNYGTIQDREGAKYHTQAAVMPMGTAKTAFTNGVLSQTGVPTDFAIEGKGFFAVNDAEGNTIYTRDGEFSVNSAGQMVNKNGYTVQGSGGAINLSTSGGDLTVDSTGQIFQSNQMIGKLKVVDFADTNSLVKVSGGFQAPAGGATEVATPSVAQGMLEGSNVNGIDEMVKLIQVARAQELNQKSIQAYDDRLSRVIQTFSR